MTPSESTVSIVTLLAFPRLVSCSTRVRRAVKTHTRIDGILCTCAAILTAGSLRALASSGTVLTGRGSGGLGVMSERKRTSRAAAFAVEETPLPHAPHPFLLAGSVAHTLL